MTASARTSSAPSDADEDPAVEEGSDWGLLTNQADSTDGNGGLGSTEPTDSLATDSSTWAAASIGESTAVRGADSEGTESARIVGRVSTGAAMCSASPAVASSVVVAEMGLSVGTTSSMTSATAAARASSTEPVAT